VTWRERAARDLEWLGEGGEGVVKGFGTAVRNPPEVIFSVLLFVRLFPSPKNTIP